MSTQPVCDLLTLRPPFNTVAFKCAGCKQLVQIPKGQPYYVDYNGLAPDNHYCHACAKGEPNA